LADDQLAALVVQGMLPMWKKTAGTRIWQLRTIGSTSSSA
jgi:hypothetical protein